MARMGEMAENGWKLLEWPKMANYDWKKLEMYGDGWNDRKW